MWESQANNCWKSQKDVRPESIAHERQVLGLSRVLPLHLPAWGGELHAIDYDRQGDDGCRTADGEGLAGHSMIDKEGGDGVIQCG